MNLIATILHDRCNLTKAGNPAAVKCSLHNTHWDKRVHLRMHTNWEGMSLGLFNNDYVIVLWARDAPKAFELTYTNNLSFLPSDELPRSKKTVSYKSFYE